MCKRVQAKKGEVLTTLGMLEDYKKRPRHSKQKKKRKKNQDDTACNINCTLWKKIQSRKCGLYSTHVR